MDFSLTSEQEMLRQSVRQFAEREVAPKVDWMEETAEVPMDTVRRMFELGFGGILVPRQYGGTGLGHVSRMIILEEIARVSAAMAFTLQIIHLGQAPIILYGTEEQKRRWLPAVTKGEYIVTSALTEPAGGSDPTSIQTTAEHIGEKYVITGRKCFITNVHISNMHGVLAYTDSSKRAKGMSFFMVEADKPGVKPGRKENKLGLRGCNTGELILDNVEVPEDNLIGNEGEGLRVGLSAVSDVGRPGVASVGVGIMHRCIEEGVKYAKQRNLYGKPISEFQAIQWHLTDIYIEYKAAQLMNYYAAWLRDKGERADAENAMAKFYSSERSMLSANKLTAIFGAYGIMKEYVPQRLLRDAEVLIPAAGTSEILRQVMNRKVLEFS